MNTMEDSTPSETIELPPEADEETATGIALTEVVESILFASQKPVSVKEIIAFCTGAANASPENPNPHAKPFARLKEETIRQAVSDLGDSYVATGRSFAIRESASGWQLVTKAEFYPWIRQLFPENRPARLSSPALETLAIIAYRQPVTRADIEAVRGVAVDGVLQTLLDRGLVKIGGRAEVPGRPLLYETTQHFLDHFGVRAVEELPNAQELRTMQLPVAEIPVESPEPESSTPVEESSSESPETPTPEENTNTNG